MSYTSKQFLISDNSSDANFRIWGKAISDAIAAMGWAQTADTGQVNWVTVTVPSSTYVYEIWEPQDAAQTGASQVFLKLEYGYSTTSVRVRWSLGTGTNGSGTLTGGGMIIGPNEFIQGTNSGGSTYYECYFSGDVDRLCIGMWVNGGVNTRWVFCLERLLDSDGTPNGDGMTWFVSLRNNSFVSGQQTMDFVFTLLGISTSNTWFLHLVDGRSNTSHVHNNNILVSPVYSQLGQYSNPQTVLATFGSPDIPYGAIFTTTLYSATRTYVSLGGNFIVDGQNPAIFNLAMRYD